MSPPEWVENVIKCEIVIEYFSVCFFSCKTP